MEFLVAAQLQDISVAECMILNECGCFGLCRLSPPPPCPIEAVAYKDTYAAER